MCEAALAVVPQETIKTKLINLNMGMVDGVSHIVKTEGIGGLCGEHSYVHVAHALHTDIRA